LEIGIFVFTLGRGTVAHTVKKVAEWLLRALSVSGARDPEDFAVRGTKSLVPWSACTEAFVPKTQRGLHGR
jgi:hypothetical protein